MALDREYFDAIHIDVVKKKYYNANKVEAVFSDIRRQAEQLSAENEQMRAQLAALNGTKVEIGGAVMAAQALYKEIVDKAKAQAAEIRAGAERERAQLLDETRRQQEYAVQRVEKCYDSMKQQHMASIDALNSRTKNGRDMSNYRELMDRAIESIVGKTEEKGVESLFARGGTALTKDHLKGGDDFEVVSFLVIQPAA